MTGLARSITAITYTELGTALQQPEVGLKFSAQLCEPLPPAPSVQVPRAALAVAGALLLDVEAARQLTKEKLLRMKGLGVPEHAVEWRSFEVVTALAGVLDSLRVGKKAFEALAEKLVPELLKLGVQELTVTADAVPIQCYYSTR